MGILDRLKPQPRWKHADPAVRLEALRQVSDERALGSIARHAKSEATAARAVARLADSKELLDTALNSDHKDVAMSAFERVAAGAPQDLALLRAIESRAQQKSV